ncbi:MAG TPA: PqqD family protein [Blastocatellia bacterium]|nr:PqqD family protein [Blastocatellia bacterium]
MSEPSQPLARSSDLVTREVADEVLVYDLKRHKAHCLNRTAALVWKHCDGQHTMADIAGLIGQDSHAIIDEATVRLAVAQLGRAHLLADGPIDLPEGFRLSRREAIRRLGLGAAAAVPLVTSIISPTAAQAATCGDKNNNNNQNAVGCPCSGADDCASNCCGFSAASGNICVSPGSVPTGSPCRANCECASGSCPIASPRVCA